MLKLPLYVKSTLDTLINAGFCAHCVGGAVRDLLMGLIPDDYDITTDALPEDVIRLFPKTVPTGLKHGTVTVVTDGGTIEVTTYRSELGYSDHRSPDGVNFVTSLSEDLKRRDFTVNAICFNEADGVLDPMNGVADINAKLLRAIGDPEKRFFEDALRILRLYRFSAQLNFDIEKNTERSALKLSYLLKELSRERIATELKKAVLSNGPQRISPLTRCGALGFCGIPRTEIPSVISKLPADFALRFAVFAHLADFSAEAVLRYLKFDNATVKNTRIFNELLSRPIPKTAADIKRLLDISSERAVKYLFSFFDADGHPADELNAALKNISDNNEPYRISMLDIGGNELAALGLCGNEIGKALENLKELVIDEPSLNKKEILLSLIKGDK